MKFSVNDFGEEELAEVIMENERKTEREKMTAGEPFFTNDTQLMEDKKHARILCAQFNNSPEDEAVRISLLKTLFGQ